MRPPTEFRLLKGVKVIFDFKTNVTDGALVLKCESPRLLVVRMTKSKRPRAIWVDMTRLIRE